MYHSVNLRDDCTAASHVHRNVGKKAVEFFNQQVRLGAMSDIGQWKSTLYFSQSLAMEEKDSCAVFPLQVKDYQDLRKLGVSGVIIDHACSDRLLFGPCSRLTLNVV